MRFQSHLATFYQLKWRDFSVGGRNGWNGNKLILGIPNTGKSPSPTGWYSKMFACGPLLGSLSQKNLLGCVF